MFDKNAVPINERETVIIIDDAGAKIYSCDFRMINRLDKFFEATKEDKYGKTYLVDKKCIHVRPGKGKRKMSERTKEDLLERLALAREKKKEKKDND